VRSDPVLGDAQRARRRTVTATPQSGRGRAPPRRPVRPGYAVTASEGAGAAPGSISGGRTPPASAAPHVAFFDDVGIGPRRDSVRGPPLPRRGQTIEYRRH
jgi:hypothetical protein